MGHWGVKSFENDTADQALDTGFERVHGAIYEDLMDDRNPLSFDQVQKRLASSETLTAAVQALEQEVGAALLDDVARWDEVARLAFAGIVVRHAELGVAIPDALKRLAIDWLEHEDIDWDEGTKRSLRRQKEMALLHRAQVAPISSGDDPA
jgi:hypothetical protein